AEQRGVTYLFKLRLTSNVKRMIAKLSTQSAWINAGQGFEAKESTVRLEGWSRQRRAIVLRRRVKGTLAASVTDDHGQQKLSFVEIGADADVYEYSVLATSLDEDISVFGQLYRDRGDAENIFDELKNQWGWGGFTTHVRHARQPTIAIASSHAKSIPVAKALHAVASFLRSLSKNAEQLTSLQ